MLGKKRIKLRPKIETQINDNNSNNKIENTVNCFDTDAT